MRVPDTAAAPPPATPPSEAAEQARAAFTGLFTDLRDFATSVLSLDPQEALLRAGLSVLVVLAAILILLGFRLLIKAIAGHIAPHQKSEENARPVSFRSLTTVVLRLAIAVIALLLVMQIWGVNLADILRGPIGAVLAIAGRSALIIVLMVAAIELCNTTIRSIFARVAARARGPRRAAQLRTIAPVVSGVVSSILFVITAMMVLAQIGVEIGPLLAGAGIVGLAVGFGAQTLVKDFLTGLFLIIEDVVSIGDVVRIKDASGLVEDMSLRTIKLRAVDGTLHVIPYGEAQTISNMTKDFSYYVFEVAISYASDLGKALDLMKQTGDELKQDKVLGASILAPIDIQGVDRLADLGVFLKARIKTAPGKQWLIGREFAKRIKFAFDDHNVDVVAQPFAKLPAEALQPPPDPHARAAE